MGRAPKKKPPPENNLEPFQKAVNEAAARIRGLWLGYIALLAYLFIAVGAVTHRDLLLQNPVKLPVLNVELPLIGFFAVAPIFFLINHFYLLLQLLGLGRRIRRFNDEIAKSGLGEEDRWDERSKLDTFVIVQMLGGTREERQQLTGKFLKAIALITLVIAPVTLLLTIQLQFLPYQYWLVTWMHRIALGIDLALLWAFWPSIRLGDWAPWRGTPVRATAVLVVLFFSFVIATFPGEVADGGIRAEDWRKPQDSYLSLLKGWLFGDLETGTTRQRLIPFSRALDLPGDKTLIDLDKFDKIRRRHRDNKDQLKPWQTDRTHSLRERNLRGAMFDRSDLRNVDLFKARLQGASLRAASLQGASLDLASLQGASLRFASLQGASLDFASLQGASLGGARLQGASLGGARLQGASLGGANLQGAWLARARLQGASLFNADLQGASLFRANLQGASLEDANLQGASLEGARLQGASLDFAKLQGASLYKTFLWRAYGEPDTGNPGRVWVKEPDLSALTAEELAEVERNALAGVEAEDVKQRIKTALARLSAPEKDVQNSLPASYWTDLAGKTSEADHRKDLADRLRALACDEENAPYVAQGLVRNRLKDVGPAHLPGVARTLLDAAEGGITNCPGVMGLDAASMAKLRKWAAEAENKTKQMAK